MRGTLEARVIAVHPAQRRRVKKASVEISLDERGIDFGEGALQPTVIVARHVHAGRISCCRLDIASPGGVELRGDE
jgi:hypothetical protein